MTDKRDAPSAGQGSGQNAAGEGAGPKRPHATLDLKAVEVKGAETSVTVTPGAEKSSAEKAGAADPAAKATGGAQTEAQKAAASSPKPAAAPLPRAPSRLGRVVTHLMAGLAGGTVVLFGGDRLAQMMGLPPAGAKLEQAAAALEKRLAAVEATSKGDPSGAYAAIADRMHRFEIIASEVEELRAAQETLAGEAKALGERIAAGADTSKLDQRLANLEGQLATLASAAGADGNGGRIPQLAAVTGKIADLEATMTAQIAQLQQSVPQDVERRLAVLGETSEAARSGAIRIDRDLTQTKTDIARLAQRIETLKADTDRIVNAVQAAQEETGRVASGLSEVRGILDQQARTFVKAADVAAAVTPVTGMISKLEGSLEGVLKKEEERQSSAERIVVSLELANLKRAVERGQEFATELEAVRKASGGRLKLSQLEQFKTDGVPTLARLQASGREIFETALDATIVKPDASVWDRLLSGAKSVVRVRKVRHEGDKTSPEAIVARLETALGEGRLADVVAEADKLPPDASSKLIDWRNKVAARLSVEQAIAATENELKAALVPQSTPPQPAAPAGSTTPAPAAGNGQ